MRFTGVMTTPHERTRTLLQTREFLQELTNPEKMPGVPEDVRRQARVLLRHYPLDSNLQVAHLALPHLFDEVPSEVALSERIQRNLGDTASGRQPPGPA